MSNKDLQNCAVELANEALRGYEFIDVVEQLEQLTDEECEQVHSLITGAVKAHLPAEPRIIRTVEELEALDPKTILIDSAKIYTVYELKKMYEFWQLPEFPPIAILATDAQVRAAREALEQEHE